MTVNASKQKKRISIIGAGASGLVQLKNLLDVFARPDVQDELEVVVFEAKEDVGGVWLWDEQPKSYNRTSITKPEQTFVYPKGGEDPSPMYDGLRTNLPHDIMQYRNYPFPADTPVFPNRAQIQAYLESYADHYKLRQHIRFSTRVDRVYHSNRMQDGAPDAGLTNDHGGENGNVHAVESGSVAGPNRKWTVESSSVDSTGERVKRVEEFDAVSVCNGHYADGWIPEIPGLSTFPGELLHSRYFSRAEHYRNQRVLVVGSFASGSEVARLIASLNVDHESTSSSSSTNGVNSDIPGISSRSIPQQRNGHDRDHESRTITPVFVSSSGEPNNFTVAPDDPATPWVKHITNVPLISHVTPPSPTYPNGQIHFHPYTPSDSAPPPIEVDTIIFATGYNSFYPFFKSTDSPWIEQRLLDLDVIPPERNGGEESDVGGMKGLTMRELDETLLFLEGDRSIAFPVLEYGVVPFPLAETQTRLTAMLWAGLLPSFPEHPLLPPHPSNPFFETPSSPPKLSTGSNGDTSASGSGTNPNLSFTTTDRGPAELDGEAGTEPTTTIPGDAKTPTEKSKPTRKVTQFRQKLAFGSPFEFDYQDYLMVLMREADKRAGIETPEEWRCISAKTRERRADVGLRKRVLGY